MEPFSRLYGNNAQMLIAGGTRRHGRIFNDNPAELHSENTNHSPIQDSVHGWCSLTILGVKVLRDYMQMCLLLYIRCTIHPKRDMRSVHIQQKKYINQNTKITLYIGVQINNCFESWYTLRTNILRATSVSLYCSLGMVANYSSILQLMSYFTCL